MLNQSGNTGHYQCLTSLLRGRPDGTATKIRIQFILCCLSGLYCRTRLGGQLMGGAAVQQLAWLGNASLLLLLNHHLYYLPHPASNATVRVTESGSAGRVKHCRLARPHRGPGSLHQLAGRGPLPHGGGAARPAALAGDSALSGAGPPRGCQMGGSGQTGGQVRILHCRVWC